MKELQTLKELLENKGLKCNFIIPNTAKEGISYPEYLRQLSLSRCVIDINQANQVGLTSVRWKLYFITRN